MSRCEDWPCCGHGDYCPSTSDVSQTAVATAAGDTVLITGNTYPVKDRLRSLGGRWDADAKGWRVPADKSDEARKLVLSAPVSHRPAYRRRYECPECGDMVYAGSRCWETGLRH